MSIELQQLLVVEDDQSQRQLICQLLAAEGYQVTQADSVETAILSLKDNPAIRLVLCDWKLGSGSGLQVLQYVRQHVAATGFVVATAYGSVSHAVDAICAQHPDGPAMAGRAAHIADQSKACERLALAWCRLVLESEG